MSPNRPAADLSDVLALAMEDLDAVADAEMIELPLTIRTRIIYWMSRAHDAGRLADRQTWPRDTEKIKKL